MAGGNVCKANERRRRELEKLAGAGKATTAEDRKKLEKYKNSVQCTVCMQGFPYTARRAELEQHAEKHEKLKKTFMELFPTFEDQA